MKLGINAILLIIAAILNLLIGAYVFLRNPSQSTNRSFSIMAVTVALWSIGVVIAHFGPLHLVGTQAAWASSALIPVATLHFVVNFPSASRAGILLWTSALLSLPLAVLAWSPSVIDRLTMGPDGLRVSYGPLQPVFALHVASCFLVAIYLLFRKYRSSDGALRRQTKHLLFAFCIPIAVGLVTNLLLPMLLGVSDSGRYGPLFSLVMVVTVAHAIVRHRLMDVRVVVKRGIVYLAAFAVTGVLLLLLLISSSAMFPDEHHIPARELALALLVGLLFHPMKGLIQRGFDHYLYREPYDYQREILRTSRALSGTIELPALIQHVGTTLSRTLRPEWHAILLLDEEGGAFLSAYMPTSQTFPDRLALASVIAERVSRDCKAVFRDKLETRATELRAEMSRLGIEVIVPLATEGRVIGLLVVGPKRSGDPYFSDDADLLSTLADQSSVAIRNAQTHQQVLEANQYIQRILETIESGVISVNARGHVRLFNRAAEVMTGGRADSLRGRPVGHLPHPLARLIGSTLVDGQCRTQSEIALPDGAGQVAPLMCSTAPLVGAQGVLVGAVAVVNDLSRLKELEKEKRRAERLAAIESIAAGLVHEIQNPLVAIKTFTQLLPSRGHDPEFRERVAQISDREITRIDDLVRRLRTLAAPASQPMEPLDVTQPLRATLDLLGPQLEERRIGLRYVSDGAPRPILGNASQLEQLFLNVCLNALEAMEPQGELTVRVADLCAAGGATLLVEVCDTGSGIPEELLPAIFNPFVTTKPRGSGLGLAICRSIADAHRATLRARNNVARPGATFTIEFPVPTGTTASLPT